MKTQKKRGPVASYLVYGGKQVVATVAGRQTGIQYDKSADTYFCVLPDPSDPSAKWKKHNLSRNKDKAVIKWTTLIQGLKPEKLIPLPTPQQQVIVDSNGLPLKKEEQEFIQQLSFFDGTNYSATMLEQWLLEQVDRMLEDPVGLANKLGREDLARLPELMAKKPLTLGFLFDEYLKKTVKPLDKKHTEDAKYMWNQFLDSTGLTSNSDVDKINRKTVNMHHDWLLAERKRQGWSITWVNHRIVNLKMVLKWNKRRLDDNTGIIKALDIVNDILTQTMQNSYDPHPISLEDFWALFDCANPQWKTILLLALNTGSYFKDIRDMQWSNIDLEKGTLVMTRVKTNLPKCAMLWKETLALLKELRAKRKDPLPWLFLSNNKTRYGTISMQSYFARVLRKQAGISKDVKFNNIRDAVKTSAEIMKARPEDVSIILGWKRSGVEDAYLKRNPQMTQDAVNLVREYFRVSEHIK